MKRNKTKLAIALAAIAACTALAISAWLWLSHTTLLRAEVERDNRIDITPEQIQSIRDIGQWEFLVVTEEVMVDTTRKRLFSDDHLARIYYGTLRIGIDMKQLGDEWFKAGNDTVTVTMPPVGLLDEQFIDEALTRSFHESGRWSPADREALYERARHRMLQHALTPQNIDHAKQLGETEIRRFLHNIGIDHARIVFRQPSRK
jgi:hypothetical protein